MAFLSGHVLSGWWQPQSCHHQVNSAAYEGAARESYLVLHNKAFLGQSSEKLPYRDTAFWHNRKGHKRLPLAYTQEMHKYIAAPHEAV